MSSAVVGEVVVTSGLLRAMETTAGYGGEPGGTVWRGGGHEQRSGVRGRRARGIQARPSVGAACTDVVRRTGAEVGSNERARCEARAAARCVGPCTVYAGSELRARRPGGVFRGRIPCWGWRTAERSGCEG